MRSAAFTLVVAGCTISAHDYGRQLLDDPSISGAASNAFACTTCHELTPPPAHHLRPAYTLYDVTSRPSYWGGYELTLLDAINQCFTNFMRSGSNLAPTDEKARAMYVYLKSISPDAASPALPITIVQNIVDVPNGDPVAGKTLYDDGCGNCHGQPHTGQGRISVKASILPDDSIAAHGTDPVMGARPVTIEKVRHGKFFNVGGNMAPYALELLSDAQLGQILGYLQEFGLPP